MSNLKIAELEPIAQPRKTFQEKERENILEDVWKGDLLGRSLEADQLEHFLVNRSIDRMQLGAEDAYTISIDRDYGTGKSWFLRRFEKQLALNHPVAFIDAWADDTADDPFGALVAGIIEALQSRLPKEEKTKSLIEKLKKNGGKIAFSSGVSVSREILKGAAGKLAEKFIGEDGKDGVKAVLDEISKEIEGLGDLAQSQFLEQRENIHEFRRLLTDLLNEITANSNGRLGYDLPLFVIIDELDRCRPTYAIKLIEEVKHLFASPGIVFIFGMNGEQLQKSISAIYGSNFDARSYLKRFVAREYNLKKLSSEKFCRLMIERNALDHVNFRIPPSVDQQKFNLKDDNDRLNLCARFMAVVFDHYDIQLRGIEQCFDQLQTFCAITKHKTHIELFYVMRLIINFHLSGTYALDDKIDDKTKTATLAGFGFFIRDPSTGYRKFVNCNAKQLTGSFASCGDIDLEKAPNLYVDGEIKNESEYAKMGYYQESVDSFQNSVPSQLTKSTLAVYEQTLNMVARLSR